MFKGAAWCGRRRTQQDPPGSGWAGATRLLPRSCHARPQSYGCLLGGRSSSHCCRACSSARLPSTWSRTFRRTAACFIGAARAFRSCVICLLFCHRSWLANRSHAACRLTPSAAPTSSHVTPKLRASSISRASRRSAAADNSPTREDPLAKVAIASDLFAVSFHCIRGATVLCRKVCTSLPEVRQRVGVCTERIPVVSTHQNIVSGDLGLCQSLLDGFSQGRLAIATMKLIQNLV